MKVAGQSFEVAAQTSQRVVACICHSHCLCNWRQICTLVCFRKIAIGVEIVRGTGIAAASRISTRAAFPAGQALLGRNRARSLEGVHMCIAGFCNHLALK